MNSALSCSGCKAVSCFIHQNGSEHFFDKADAVKENISFRAGEMIFREGEYARGLHFVKSGKVKVFINDRHGSEQIIRFACDGGIFGCRGLGKKQVYPVSAIALEDSLLCFFPMDKMMELFRMNPSFALSFAKFFADELKRTESK